MAENLDKDVVAGFGDEWSRFDQSTLSGAEHDAMFDNYFNIFPWDVLDADAVGFDLGCGSGRWAVKVAPRVGLLHLIDPSEAIEVAKKNLAGFANCDFHRAGVDDMPIDDESCDFGYCLGVLHHIPDTRAGLQACVDKLRPGSPFLLYLYYRFDNRPMWFRFIWMGSEAVRLGVSRLPRRLNYGISQAIAAMIYFPLARTARVLSKIGVDVRNFPLNQYRDRSFYVMRTDALDCFGTRLEKRYTKSEIGEMMESCGLENIRFSETSFWTALGYKK